MTLFPSAPPGELPHYRLVLASAGAPPALDAGAVCAAFEEALGAANDELRAKRASARLGPVRLERLPYDALAAALQRGAPGARGWETQFKLLPLSTRTWEDVGLDAREVLT